MMRPMLNIKTLAIIVFSTMMLIGCGRKNSLSPTGITQPATPSIEGEATTEPVVEDKPFILDKLL